MAINFFSLFIVLFTYSCTKDVETINLKAFIFKKSKFNKYDLNILFKYENNKTLIYHADSLHLKVNYKNGSFVTLTSSYSKNWNNHSTVSKGGNCNLFFNILNIESDYYTKFENIINFEVNDNHNKLNFIVVPLNNDIFQEVPEFDMGHFLIILNCGCEKIITIKNEGTRKI